MSTGSNVSSCLTTSVYRKELEEKIRLKKEDIEAHGKTRPEEKANPEADTATPSAETAQVEDLTRKIAELAEQIAQCETEQVETTAAVEQLRQVRQAIAREEASLTGLETEHGATLEAAALSFGQIVKLTLAYGPLDTVVSQKERKLEAIAALLLSREDIAAMDSDDEAGLIPRVPQRRRQALFARSHAGGAEGRTRRAPREARPRLPAISERSEALDGSGEGAARRRPEPRESEGASF